LVKIRRWGSVDRGDAVDSQFTRAIEALASRFEHRLFLTATPHNGHSNSFTKLLEILDPQRFTAGVDVRPDDLTPIMVRRLPRLGPLLESTVRRGGRGISNSNPSP
jgi:hypothetical protein